MSRTLSTQQLDRCAGVLLGSAAGDALGVPYEFAARTQDPHMIGGGLGSLAPGQWSDDTDMANAITRVAATGADLTTQAGLDAVAAGFHAWFTTSPGDVGIQTRQVLRASEPTAASMRAAAHQVHERTGRSAGNGSLMRTGPVALAHLYDEKQLVAAARAVSNLTHYEPDAGDACVLWCLALRHAILSDELDLRAGLPHVADAWAVRLDQAEAHEPAHFSGSNGWVVSALQGAWSAVVRSDSLADGLRRAVSGGGDTDTVAAIAGALLGARYGASAVPGSWRRTLHGWPGWRAGDLTRLAVTIVRGDDPDGWPSCSTMRHPRASKQVVPHPDDPRVLLGTVGALSSHGAEATVSLCRLGTDEVGAADHLEVWLVDKDNANLDPAAVLRDTAELVKQLRGEGNTVFLHCVHAHTRTPLAAAAYGALITNGDRAAALARVLDVLPSANPRPSLTAAFLDEPL